MTLRLGDRSLFPDLRARAYLNHAAISPPSSRVRAAVDRLLSAYAREGVGAFAAFHAQRGALRRRLATLIGAASGDDIAFVPNTTRGVSDVALCFPWRDGDAILVPAGEFPANVTPWQQAAALYRLELRMLEAPTAASMDRWLDGLDAALKAPRARLLAVSAVAFQTGLRLPLEAIGERCARHGVALFVDAIQACGVVPIDVARARIDYLSCGSHKWLMGTEGFGMLYVSPERAQALRPVVAGWLSHVDPLAFLQRGAGELRYDRPIARRPQLVEGGMLNNIGAAALDAALEALLALGIDAIFAHVNQYHDALEPRLCALGFSSERAADPALRSGASCFFPPPGVDIVALHAAIDPALVSCSMPDGRLRFSPHWPNAHDEVDGVVDAIQQALERCAALG